jgi:hypothetical protein
MTNLKFNKAQIHRRGINFGRNGTGGARPRSEKLIRRRKNPRLVSAARAKLEPGWFETTHFCSSQINERKM